MATVNQAYGTYTALSVTALQSLANSATVGWQSPRVSNITTLALDYEIYVDLTTAATAAANDLSVYIYIVPWITTDGGTTWVPTDQGTTTLPTGSDATTTIAIPNDLNLLGVLAYNVASQPLQKVFNLSNAVGPTMPDGFSIIIINYTGAALSTGCVVAYRPITNTVA